jgi:hypothetical protein
MIARREFVKTGLAGAAVLALTSCARSSAPAVPPFDDPNFTYRTLSGTDRSMVAAIARVMLRGALPSDPADLGLVKAVRGVDVAIAGLTLPVQGEVHQLFGLLEFPVSRGLAAGVWTSWEDASATDIANFLMRWRYSSVTLFRTGYQALHQLIMSGWYGNPAAWTRIGYPGPPPLGA